MKMFFKSGLIFALANVSIATAKSQGCSDAGFCSVGNLSANHASKKTTDHHSKTQKITYSSPIGLGDENVFVFTPGVQYDKTFSDRWSLQSKITSNYASGNLGQVFGPGDVYLSGTYNPKSKSSWQTSFTLGTKLPLNQSNLKENGLSLPMQYQSSLGTIDLITGVNVSNRFWQFSAGWQQPLSGINRNNFLPVYWDNIEAKAYPPSNDFNRKSDVLARVAYHNNINPKLNFSAGLLGIYHTGEDTYIDGNVSNKPLPIKGSSGLTINLTGGIWYAKNHKISIGLSGGVPLVIRDVRPDGLTRSFVVSPEISINF